MTATTPGRARATGDDIRSVRLALRLELRDVALRADVELALLKRWERGLARPPAGALKRLAEVLGVSYATLKDAQARYADVATPGEGYTTAKAITADGTTVLARRIEPAPDHLSVLDLFCGSGGFSYGFEQTRRFAVTGGLDLLPDRISTYQLNHPAAAALIGDIRAVSFQTLVDAAGTPDVIIGGPPCQGFSSIRPFRTFTVGDPRNNLFEHFAVIVAELRPRWFVLENVVGLLTHGGGQVLPALLDAFKDAGYTTSYAVLNGAQYGLPQNRERLVVVGNREGRRFIFPRPTHASDHRSMAGKRAPRVHDTGLFGGELLPPAVSVMQAIHDLPAVAAGERAIEYLKDVVPTPYERRMRDGSHGLTLHEATAHSEKMLAIIRQAGSNRSALPEGLTTSGFSSCYSRLSPEEPSVTITVNFVHPSSNKCIHPFQHRALTPREGARLQGFPDRFEFSGSRTQIVKQIGNAVPPLLGQVIAEAILAQW